MLVWLINLGFAASESTAAYNATHGLTSHITENGNGVTSGLSATIGAESELDATLGKNSLIGRITNGVTSGIMQ